MQPPCRANGKKPQAAVNLFEPGDVLVLVDGLTRRGRAMSRSGGSATRSDARGGGSGWREPRRETPTEILDRRFAEGAISVEEYQERLKVLTG
jgi:hypothetical protein